MVSKTSATCSELGNTQSKTLIFGDAQLASQLGCSLSTIRDWRSKRVIPFVKTGVRQVVYNLRRVLDALDALEIRSVTKPTTRKH
jgi:excisionase family DNA binding protein